MTAVFEKLLEMSATASVVIGVVLVIRLLLRKAPKKYSYALWAVAAFRLVCPVSFEAVFSIFRFARKGEGTALAQTTAPVPTADLFFASVPSDHPVPAVTIDLEYVYTYPAATPAPVDPAPAASVGLVDVAAILWCVGLAALLLYGVVSYVRLRRRMANGVRMEGNVFQSDRVRSPFILGFVRPKIYLPFGLTEEQQSYVLAHERYHIRRFDHIVRPAAFLILTIHWFNPLVWVAYYMMSRDMEMSCDEKVLGGGENIRKAYSMTLLAFAANRRFPAPSPLAFGETGVKDRIKNALNWKKPRLWVKIAAIVVCVAVVAVCAANPKEPDARAAAWEWMSTVTAEDVSRIDAGAEGVTGVVYDGDNKYIDPLGNEKVRVLVDKLNAVPEEALVEGTDGEWRLSLTVDCGGRQYILRLSDDRLGLTCGETTWLLESEELEIVVRNFAADVLGWELVYQLETYVAVECLYLSPASSQLFQPYLGNGTKYIIGSTVILPAYEPDADGPLPSAMGDWEELTEERWFELFLGVAPRELEEFDRPMIRTAGDGNYLLDMDGELWFVDGTSDPRGRAYVWAMYRLAKTGEALAEPEPPEEDGILARWAADLTHDGQDEIITLRGTDWHDTQEQWTRFTLTVTDASGSALWTGEAGSSHVGWNGYYLYQQDGRYYLLNWVPYGSTGIFDMRYSVFSLTGDGAVQVLAENEVNYDVMASSLMALDVAELYRFEAEVNALLANAEVLFANTDNGKVQYMVAAEPFSGYAAGAEEQQKALFASGDQILFAYSASNERVQAMAEVYLEQILSEFAPQNKAMRVDSMEEIPTGCVGLTDGCFLYRVEYQLVSLEDKPVWQERERFYLVVYEDWSGSWRTYTELGMLTEKELQERYNTPERMEQYGGDVYLAAAAEMLRDWQSAQ